ncbi:MGH1-like glycoside hydrolase domain-containing protein [Paenibacillus sp. Soil750]|uniref:MGH1-like glycoside hydrolase domain-containing protein n=1 Tax=Paenibacillus sp. Soil750 TaxID=1736398 RepID=UPI0007C7E73C|nr:trehalase family glycosidase [Paenibacillus sp. Soil750]
MSKSLEIDSTTLPETQVIYTTDNGTLQRLFDRCEEMGKKNIQAFLDKKVLVEGSYYPNVWLETQPMGGEMYAKRNMEVALNNQLIFMENQRADGRIPGMISVVEGELQSDFDWFQGYCFPVPALKMYYWMKKDKNYLQRLYDVLKGFDDYLWKYRDSDGDGCLETWCVWDTGEDHSTRLPGAPDSWGGETPPSGIGQVPYESMDVMGYSCSGRDVIAIISKELGNGQESYWQEKADEVRQKIKSYLWRADRHACYDRDSKNEFMDVLTHNNLRVMYFGGFSQEMADAFIAYHMLNPEEFWTTMPLPSIAVNDPLFRNIASNDWSGQPQSLTYQRAIQALENYGHYAEITLLGKIYLSVLEKHLFFPQQFDPFTAEPSKAKDGYGPAILSALEYHSRLYGVSISMDDLFWGGLQDGEFERSYTQQWAEDRFTLKSKHGFFSGYINEKQVFRASNGVRIVTDLQGQVKEIIGIETKPTTVRLEIEDRRFTFTIKPNEAYVIENKGVIKKKRVAFDYPFAR